MSKAKQKIEVKESRKARRERISTHLMASLLVNAAQGESETFSDVAKRIANEAVDAAEILLKELEVREREIQERDQEHPTAFD